MEAVRDDEPRGKGSGNGKTGLRVLIVGAVVGAAIAIYLLSGRGSVLEQSNPVQERESRSANETPQPAPGQLVDEAQTSTEESEQTAEAAFWEQVERDRERTKLAEPSEPLGQEPARQTSFSDANYTPPKQVNIIQSVPVRDSRRSTSVRQQSLSGSKTASVHWEDARGNTSRWKTTFDFQDNRIDNSTFCLNVGKGSIPYRECRKGAQEWLKTQCRAAQGISDDWRRMYCQAYSSYRT